MFVSVGREVEEEQLEDNLWSWGVFMYWCIGVERQGNICMLLGKRLFVARRRDYVCEWNLSVRKCEVRGGGVQKKNT